jgi:hypothetical protein
MNINQEEDTMDVLAEYRDKTIGEILDMARGKEDSSSQSQMMSLVTLLLSEILGCLAKPSAAKTISMPSIEESEFPKTEMGLDEFDRYLEGEDLDKILHQARSQTEEWFQADGIAALAVAISHLIENWLTNSKVQER